MEGNFHQGWLGVIIYNVLFLFVYVGIVLQFNPKELLAGMIRSVPIVIVVAQPKLRRCWSSVIANLHMATVAVWVLAITEDGPPAWVCFLDVGVGFGRASRGL